MQTIQPIDFVVPWVDNSDPMWAAKKAKYTGVEEKEGNSEVRYRDWDTLKYWFRGVEKFAPWVHNVFFITDDQMPDWLNTNHPKLKWVKHTDYIPAEYLPTFSAQAIEWNLHRIRELSEQFVYFNDDVFLIDETKPEDFFVNGEPCDLPNIGPLYACGFFSHLLFNNIELINRHFFAKDAIRKNRKKWIAKQSPVGLLKVFLYGRKQILPGCDSWHIHTNFRKSTFQKLWDAEHDVIHNTCCNKLRTREDVTSYCVRNWQLMSGDFHPQKPIGKTFQTASLSHNNEAIDYLKNQKGKVICLNDTEDETDFSAHKQSILDAFEKLLPEKSAFEL